MPSYQYLAGSPADAYNWDWLGYLPAFFLLGAMTILPTVSALLYWKATTIALLLFLVVATAMRSGRFCMSYGCAAWTVFIASVGAIFGVRGLLRNAPGAVAEGQTYIFWPLVFLLLIGGVTSMRECRWLCRTLEACTLLISAYGILFFLSQVGIIGHEDFWKAFSFQWEELGSGLYGGFTQLSFPGLGSLPFLAPAALAALAVDSGRWWSTRRFMLWTAAILSIVVMLVSGRRALWVVILVSPLTIAFFSCILPSEQRRRCMRRVALLTVGVVALLAASFFVLQYTYDFNVLGVTGRVAGGFDFSTTTVDDSANVRLQQIGPLLQGIEEHPVMGSGFGEPAYGNIRSQIRPWSYELSYLALIFHVGIFGFLAYVSVAIWLMLRCASILRAGGATAELMLPLMVGLSSMLAAHATNPYMDRFDALWAIFIPMAIVNLDLCATHPGTALALLKPEPVEG